MALSPCQFWRSGPILLVLAARNLYVKHIMEVDIDRRGSLEERKYLSKVDYKWTVILGKKGVWIGSKTKNLLHRLARKSILK